MDISSSIIAELVLLQYQFDPGVFVKMFPGCQDLEHPIFAMISCQTAVKYCIAISLNYHYNIDLETWRLLQISSVHKIMFKYEMEMKSNGPALHRCLYNLTCQVIFQLITHRHLLLARVVDKSIH